MWVIDKSPIDKVKQLIDSYIQKHTPPTVWHDLY